MAISELIQGIINERKAKLPIIERKNGELKQMKDLLGEYDSFKSRIVNKEGNVIDGPFKSIAEKNPDMVINLNALTTGECRSKVDVALAECEKAYNRFNRDSVNISVIGKAGVGKSAFLQAVSNLDNDVIPSFDDTDCTGAVSVIHNSPGTKLSAHLIFNSVSEMLQIVQNYLDKIIEDEIKRIRLSSIEQIKSLNIDDIIDNRMKAGAAVGNLLAPLKKYIDGYDEWIECVKLHERILNNKTQIQEYVAQNNGKKEGHVDYYKYLAVKSCDIYCTFDYQEAGKITLLDTVGLGDTSLGIEEQMISTVRDKSDAVVFMVKPSGDNARQMGGIDEATGKIYEMVKKACGDRNLDLWLFWLVNLYKEKTEYQCNLAKKAIIANKWFGRTKEIINVKDKKELRETFLIPLLESLTSNLGDIDGLYMDDLRNTLNEVIGAYARFCDSAKKLMSSKLGDATAAHPQITRKVRDIYNKMTGSLNQLAEREREGRELPSKELKLEIDKIIKDLRTRAFLPEKSELKSKLSYSQPQPLYVEYCNHIRTEITQRFAAVDTSLHQLVIQMKNSIAGILIADNVGRLGKILSVDSFEQPYEWIESFAENILMDGKNYPNLYPAFKNVQNFDFSVKGFLTYEVRACLDCLDPSLMNIPNLVNGDPAENTYFWLDRMLLNVSDELDDRINKLLNKPHRAFFAFIKEFSDKVVYGEDVFFEWDKLYSENYPIVWAEDYKDMAVQAKSFEEWSVLLKKLLELNSKTQQLMI